MVVVIVVMVSSLASDDVLDMLQPLHHATSDVARNDEEDKAGKP